MTHNGKVRPEHRIGAISFRNGEVDCKAGCHVTAEPGNPQALAQAWTAHRLAAGAKLQGGTHLGNDRRE